MRKALIHDGVFQYIDSGRVNIAKPKTAKWVPVIEGGKPEYDSQTQRLVTTKKTNDDSYEISYSVENKDPQELMENSARSICSAAVGYINSKYDMASNLQILRKLADGNAAQIVEARKLSDWVDDVTLEMIDRVAQLTLESPIGSTDFSSFDESDPVIDIVDLMLL